MSWDKDKLWKKEWPQYRGHVRRFWLDVKAKDWKEVTHSWTNLKTEFFREFAYTLGHIWQTCEILALIFIPLWAVYKLTVGQYGVYAF